MAVLVHPYSDMHRSGWRKLAEPGNCNEKPGLSRGRESVGESADESWLTRSTTIDAPEALGGHFD
jgi:hypothetical protein